MKELFGKESYKVYKTKYDGVKWVATDCDCVKLARNFYAHWGKKIQSQFPDYTFYVSCGGMDMESVAKIKCMDKEQKRVWIECCELNTFLGYANYGLGKETIKFLKSELRG